MSTHATMLPDLLPPPQRAALSAPEMAGRPVSPAVRQELLQLGEREPVYLVLRTRTRHDTGRWFLWGRVAAAALDRELLLLAPGPRPLSHRIAYTELRHSAYNYVTGELALRPAAGSPVRALRLPASEASQLLAQIHWKDGSP